MMPTPRAWHAVYCHSCGALAVELPYQPDPDTVAHCLACAQFGCRFRCGAQ